MESKLVFLGTAGDSITSGKQNRASGGILIRYDDLQLIINPGPGTLVRAKQYGVNLRETTAILVSQNTLLDANDVNATVDAMTNGGLDQKGILICSRSTIDGNSQFYPAISRFHASCLDRIIPLNIGDKVGLETVEVIPTKTSIDAKDSLGFQIVTPRFTISYIGDTRYERRVADCHKESDIVIVNIPTKTKSEQANTTDVADAVKFMKHIQPRLAIVTRLGVKLTETQVLDLVRTIQKETRVQTMAAKDGLLINPITYSAIVRQQKLFSQ